jgi:N-acetylneuraminic acid mutarotase
MRRHILIGVACFVGLVAGPATAQVQGTWFTTTNNLSSPVELNVQVLLHNGNVLVAGGTDGTTYLATAQLYNPSTHMWTPTGSMATGRESFAAVVLPNGKVLVEGGLGPSGSILASAELYNPATGRWSSAGAMSVARYSHTATLLPNGTVLVAGGCSASYSCTPYTGVSEIYNPATNTWTRTGALNVARANQTATLLHNGKVLVVGGFTNSSSCEIYDPAAKTWKVAASNLHPRYAHAAALLANGKVLVTGGNCVRCALSSAELYDPVANTWTATGNMKLGRFAHSATTLANNTVLIAAGAYFRGCGRSVCFIPTTETEIYDVATGTFAATGSLKQWRMYHTASLLQSGRAMVLGGNDYYGLSSTAEIYTPLTLSISPLNMTFGLEQIGLTTATQKATVTNVSHSAVPFAGIAASGDFVQKNTCPPSLAAGASCSISVSFKPTAAGARSGGVTLNDSSVGSPSQTIALTGTGELYAIGFTPSALTLPSVVPGSSTTATATVTNDGSAPVNISSISITPANGTFTQTNNCPSTLGVKQTCTIQVVFTPPDSVTFTQTLQIFDNAKSSPHRLALTGTGLD